MAKEKYKVCYASTGEIYRYTFQNGGCFYHVLDNHNKVKHVKIDDDDNVVFTPVTDPTIIEEMIKLRESKE